MSSVCIEPHLNIGLSVFLRSKHNCYTGCRVRLLHYLNFRVVLAKFNSIFIQVVVTVIDYCPISFYFDGNLESRKKISSNIVSNFFENCAIIQKNVI